MSTITAAEASLINDTEFLEELEGFEHVPVPRPDSRTRYADAFEALESGLPMNAVTGESDALQGFARGVPTSPSARHGGAPHHERAPIDEPYEAPGSQPAPAGQQITFLTAALVLAACLTVGAATAALVFHDRLTLITALRSANR